MLASALLQGTATADAGDLPAGLTPYVVVESPIIRVYNADCLGGMRQVLGEGMVSVVVTSPPYNIGVRYNSYRDTQPREEYLSWMERVGLEVRRVLEPEGSFFLNVGNKPSDPWVAWDVANRLRKHFVLQNVIHWVKSIAITRGDVGHYPNIRGDIAVGHYKPIAGSRYLNDCQEYIFHFTKSGAVKLDRLAIGVPYQDKSNIGRWKKATQDRRCRGNTWFIPYQTIRDRASQRPHPSTFPPALPEMCLRLHGVNNVKLVLDPFVGIGSTPLACLKLDVPCVGFDIDSTYLDIAGARLRVGALAPTPMHRGRDGQGELPLG